jgi:hypothetical protein
MRHFDLGGTFSSILIPGNSLLHLLTNEELKECFGCVRRPLEPSGRLIFDISKWDMSRYARDPTHRYHAFTQDEITIEETTSYDAAAQVRDVVWHLSAPGAPDFRRIEYRLRVIFPQELLWLLECAEFRLEARYGEFTREPFESASPRQVCICALQVLESRACGFSCCLPCFMWPAGLDWHRRHRLKRLLTSNRLER